jgi:endonuclease/exonuclease/phosphatase (EEP) superfamily protein YafD
MVNEKLNRKICFNKVLVSGAWGLFILSILSLGHGVDWTVGLLDHFRIYYTLLSLAGCMFALLLKHQRLLGAFMAIALINLWVISPWNWRVPQDSNYGPSQPSQPGERPSLIWFNLNSGNRSHALVRKYLEERDADVIVLAEINQRWLHQLEFLGERWPHRILHPREDNFGLAVFSKRPCSSSELIQLDALKTPTIHFTLKDSADKVLHVFAVHPLPPISRRYTRSRDVYLERLSRQVASIQSACLVVGDFNGTPWHPPIQRLLSVSGLFCCVPHAWYLPATWPSRLSPLGIPIDLCLANRELSLKDLRVGPDLGSDHRPLEIVME